MAYPREPDDENIRRRAEAGQSRNVPPRQSRFSDDMQPDLELTEGPASSGRIAAYAIAALLIVGAVLYGIAHTSTNSPSAGNIPPPASSTVRNGTPGLNSQPGTTTGVAPAPNTTPQNNPAPAPSGSGTNR
jgi:hypothetical protein